MKRVLTTIAATMMLASAGLVQSATAGPLTAQVLSAAGNGIAPASAVVGPGPEFAFTVFSDPYTFDFDDDGQITITVVIASGQTILGPTRIYTFSDLNGTIPDIIGAGFLGASPGVSGLDASDISFTADSVTIDLRSSTWNSGTRTAQFELAFAVPEPATLALLGAGPLGLGFLRRRRMRAA